MAEERDKEEFGGTEGGEKGQPTTDQQGQQDKQSGGSAPPQNQGAESGGQSSSGQAQAGSEADTMAGERNATGRGGGSGSEGEGFIGSQGTGTDEHVEDREDQSGADFASKGQGALDEESNEDDSGSSGEPL